MDPCRRECGGCLQVGRGDVVAGNDRLHQGDDLVKTAIGVEVRLNAVEKNDGAVSTTAAVTSIRTYLSTTK